MEQYIGETKLKVYTCKNCGQDTIKVKLIENYDEISIDVMKCTVCNYQSTLSELTYGK
jgi:predicted SprT family Zn-dependent metalloprotease